MDTIYVWKNNGNGMTDKSQDGHSRQKMDSNPTAKRLLSIYTYILIFVNQTNFYINLN